MQTFYTFGMFSIIQKTSVTEGKAYLPSVECFFYIYISIFDLFFFLLQRHAPQVNMVICELVNLETKYLYFSYNKISSLHKTLEVNYSVQVIYFIELSSLEPFWNHFWRISVFEVKFFHVHRFNGIVMDDSL